MGQKKTWNLHHVPYSMVWDVFSINYSSQWKPVKSSTIAERYFKTFYDKVQKNQFKSIKWNNVNNAKKININTLTKTSKSAFWILNANKGSNESSNIKTYLISMQEHTVFLNYFFREFLRVNSLGPKKVFSKIYLSILKEKLRRKYGILRKKTKRQYSRFFNLNANLIRYKLRVGFRKYRGKLIRKKNETVRLLAPSRSWKIKKIKKTKIKRIWYKFLTKPVYSSILKNLKKTVPINKRIVLLSSLKFFWKNKNFKNPLFIKTLKSNNLKLIKNKTIYRRKKHKFKIKNITWTINKKKKKMFTKKTYNKKSAAIVKTIYLKNNISKLFEVKDKNLYIKKYKNKKYAPNKWQQKKTNYNKKHTKTSSTKYPKTYDEVRSNKYSSTKNKYDQRQNFRPNKHSVYKNLPPRIIDTNKKIDPSTAYENKTPKVWFDKGGSYMKKNKWQTLNTKPKKND